MRKIVKKVVTILTVICVLVFETIPMNISAAEVNTFNSEEDVLELCIDTVSGNEGNEEENVTTGTLGYDDGVQWSYDASTKTLTVTGEDSGVCGDSYGNPFYYNCIDAENIIVQDCKLIGEIDYLFYEFESLYNIEFINFDTSDVTSMDSMFAYCSSLKSVDLSGINTSNVTNMSGMFSDCSSLESLDLSSINTSNVTNMSGMFSDCSSLKSVDLSGINTSNVTNMSDMFSGCSSLKSVDLSGINTSNVTNMSDMFSGCSSLESLDLSGINTSNVTNMTDMFYSCEELESVDVRDFDTSNVAGMGGMFAYCSSLKSVDVSGFDTSNVIDMGSMFNGCTVLKSVDVSNFDTSNVTDMNGMFTGCFKLESIDVSGFDTSKVTDMRWMFEGCTVLKSVDVSGFDTSNITNMSGMFGGCYYLENLDVSGFDTSNVTDMSGMFKGCRYLENLDVSGFDTSKVTGMSYMFSCGNLKDLDVSGFDTSNVTSMMGMFSECWSLKDLDVSGFDTSNVTDMYGMFSECSNMESLNLSGLDTSNVTRMENMFRDCSNLRTIYTPKVMITGQFITLPDTFYDSEMKSVTKLALDNCNMILVKPYTINYILNGGVQNENNPLSYLLSEEDVVLFAPTHEGYQFLGWYSDAEFSEQVQIIPAGSVGDITLYAQWQKIVVDSVYIILDKTSLSMEQGSTYNLKATMEPLNTTDVVTWSSSNQDVAKVSDAGVVTALSKGMAIITATTTSGKTATCTVTVNIPLTAITLNETSLSIMEGETYTLKATLTPSNSTDIITWSSSEANVAKVSTDGVVTAVKKGTAIITVTSANGVQATCKVTVKAKEIPATKIKLNKTKVTINKGKTLTLKAALTPTSSTDTIKWTSSKKSIAKVTGNGKKATVTALKKGTTTITAKTSSGKKVTCKVTVKEIKATKIKLNKTKVTIKKGKSLTLKATLTPKNSTDTVTWTSSSKKVAKVSNKGKVTALKKGTATITAKTSSGKKVTCKVTVK